MDLAVVLAGIPLRQIRENSNFLKIKSCYQFFSSSFWESMPGSCQSKSLGKEEEEERTVAFFDPEAVAAAAF